MFKKLDNILIELKKILNKLNDPLVIRNITYFKKLMKKKKYLTLIKNTYNKYKYYKQDILNNIEMLNEENDYEMRKMIKTELCNSKKQVKKLKKKIKILLLPKDNNDNKNVIVEIRAGTGGNEATLFANDIYRMYVKFSEIQKWKIDIVNYNENKIGGFKEITFIIKGKNVYSKFKYESGVHRVQRIPVTENNGRIHTSTITVAVIPEANEIDFHLNISDCKFDVFRASGNGGQCVNTTDSAVRLTHLPTGIVISCQDEKSQLKNKNKAIKVLRSRLYNIEVKKRHDKEAKIRKIQIGTGKRSEKIRTYNFPNNKIIDHRIKFVSYNLHSILNGNLSNLLNNLIVADQKLKLSKVNYDKKY